MITCVDEAMVADEGLVSKDAGPVVAVLVAKCSSGTPLQEGGSRGTAYFPSPKVSQRLLSRSEGFHSDGIHLTLDLI